MWPKCWLLPAASCYFEPCKKQSKFFVVVVVCFLLLFVLLCEGRGMGEREVRRVKRGCAKFKEMFWVE